MLSAEQLRQFETEGFVVVEDVLDQRQVLEPLIAEYEALLGDLWQGWIAEGVLAADDPATSFDARIRRAYGNGLEYFQPMDISLPPGRITEDIPFHFGPAVFAMLTAPKLLDIVEQVIGPEITSNPIQHIRIKPPAGELRREEARPHITATSWHQDRAVTLEEADATRMVTVWIAVTDATVENGCLQAVPGSHRGDMLTHCPQVQLAIPADLMQGTAAKPLPVRAGGVVLFHPLTIHGSLANRSAGIRWSFDVRYNVTGDPTGRPMFPAFVARSRAAPGKELRDAAAWRRMWEETRRRLSTGAPTTIHRWPADAAPCA